MRLSTQMARHFVTPQLSRNMGIIGIALVGALFGAMLLTHAEPSAAPAPTLALTQAEEPTFRFGPIEGLTSSWHAAPPATSIPLGTYLQLHQPASLQNTVTWIGAEEVARDAQGSTAECWLLQPGSYTVGVEVTGGFQTSRQDVNGFSSFSELDVVNIAVDDIAVSVTDVWVDPVEIDENLPEDELNELTMSYYFGESIARLTDLGDSAYRTSVNRAVHASVDVDPPGFAPLIEWRINDEPLMLGPMALLLFAMDDIGNHVVGIGPIWTAEVIEIETYSVTITSHTSGEDVVPEGEPIVFVAETNPPGYEAEITWLSSTKYGTAIPVLGQGPVFIAQFDDTWDVDDNGNLGQWLGVKADNTAFGQDQKEIGCCQPSPNCGVCPGRGNCFADNGTVGCADADICNAVCAIAPSCCEVQWDQACADLASAVAGIFGPCQMGSGNCLQANGTPGCDDRSCCELICALDPVCCGDEWDATCAYEATASCTASPTEFFVDEFDDGILDPFMYSPLGNAVLFENGGKLFVIPQGSEDGLLITNPLNALPPISEHNQELSSAFILDFTPSFQSDDAGLCTVSTFADGGRLLDITTYDNATGTISVTRGDGFGGLDTIIVSQFRACAKERLTDEWKCSWIPPGWKKKGCTWTVIPWYDGETGTITWTYKFGAFGDAPIDSAINNTFIESVQVVSTDGFTIARLEFDNVTGGEIISEWIVQPSHVRVTGGDIVTVSGLGIGLFAPYTITVGESPAADVTIIDESTMNFVVPPNPKGVIELRITSTETQFEVVLDNDLRYYASPEPLLLSRDALPVANTGVPYSEQIDASGGVGELTFSFASGSLPQDVSLQPDGTLNGIPDGAGVFAFFVQVIDQSGEEDLRMFFLEVQ